MGRTFVDVEVENYDDIVLREPEQRRRRHVRKDKVEALVDTASALLCLHRAATPALACRRGQGGSAPAQGEGT